MCVFMRVCACICPLGLAQRYVYRGPPDGSTVRIVYAHGAPIIRGSKSNSKYNIPTPDVHIRFQTCETPCEKVLKRILLPSKKKKIIIKIKNSLFFT